ncbi:major facilitator superfamily domain-containing protein [Truncatella angustata]|uniref:Major facilitator superfamily domain-containing protein n=1 Tax=Truncatella angustata TaxID=152316 RepID=A0A9P8UUR7_9PEZI|nr:major facilitator superfamily domain-containing protein [Truncatella angustata]KAH6658569.1 major facilitator superfamily domain-containing protein [Truncatella angustata]
MDQSEREAASRRGDTRRFTTMEGWREVANNLYYIAGQGLINIDADLLDDDKDIITRKAVHTRRISSLAKRNDDINAIKDTNKSVNSEEKLEAVVVEEPYHIFPPRQRWQVVITIGAAGLFSGLSSNIYFPALDLIAQDLNVSLQLVSLTITSYLIIQGISPVIWGSFADALGRRPIYIASFSVYILANIALSFSPNFIVLIVFRGLQAAGSASTVSIGNGVIQDIAPPAKRGSYISFYQAIRNFSIAVGPVLGGALSNSFGFRSIFVFLFVISSIVLTVIVIFLPETMRSIAGNGSIRLKGIYNPLIRLITKEPNYMQDPEEAIVRKGITVSAFTDPLRLFLQKDVLLNLIFGGVIYTIWSMVTSTTTSLFKSAFGLNELLIGLSFLPNGVGTIVGSAIIGNLMNRDFRTAEGAYKVEHNLPAEFKLPAKALPADFKIEHARLNNLSWVTLLFVASTGVYGLTVQNVTLTSLPGWIIVPLLLQFLIAATSNAVFAMNQTLVSDLCPGKGASSTAINNLVRCSLAAVGVAFAETMLGALGPAVSFLLLAFIVVIFIPIAVVNWFYGPTWRMERLQMQERLERKESA